MDNVGRVHVLYAAQQLVEKVLQVVVGERLLREEDPRQIRLHVLEHHVDILAGGIGHHEHLVNAHNVVVIAEMLQHLELAQSAAAKGGDRKDVRKALDGEQLPSGIVADGTDAHVS